MQTIGGGESITVASTGNGPASDAATSVDPEQPTTVSATSEITISAGDAMAVCIVMAVEGLTIATSTRWRAAFLTRVPKHFSLLRNRKAAVAALDRMLAAFG
ncbi:MAG: hypothetical protein Q8S73_05765 [Deltaproteobacteria bacterium]|nr:hypothetical protein [Myxococcales bacterium]MDP3213589.1 hypothetical protein [Deltaproteobacteria bacterium]